MGKTIYIPESLEDIKMDSLIRFTKVNPEDEQLQMYQAFWLFCEMEKDIVKALTFQDAQHIYKKIGVALNQKPELKRTFEMDGVKYGMIPNLENITFGEYIDLDSYITPQEEGQVLHEEAFKFMATLYRPITEEVKGLYQIEPYNDSSDSWRVFKEHCKADVYLGAVSFFLTLKQDLLIALKRYLQVASQEIQAKQAQDLAVIGDGLEALTAWLKEMSLNTTQSQHYPLKWHLPNSLTISNLEKWQNNHEEIKNDERLRTI